MSFLLCCSRSACVLFFAATMFYCDLNNCGSSGGNNTGRHAATGTTGYTFSHGTYFMWIRGDRKLGVLYFSNLPEDLKKKKAFPNVAKNPNVFVRFKKKKKNIAAFFFLFPTVGSGEGESDDTN